MATQTSHRGQRVTDLVAGLACLRYVPNPIAPDERRNGCCIYCRRKVREAQAGLGERGQ